MVEDESGVDEVRVGFRVRVRVRVRVRCQHLVVKGEPGVDEVFCDEHKSGQWGQHMAEQTICAKSKVYC